MTEQSFAVRLAAGACLAFDALYAQHTELSRGGAVLAVARR